MKQAERKDFQAKKERIERMIHQCNYNKETLVSTLGEYDFQSIIQKFTDSVALLEKEIQSIPIHHEYNGTFYLRKPYTEPLEVIKVINGKIIMREDLVTWKVYLPDGEYYGLARLVYKDKELRTSFKREDGHPILENELEAEAR
ncbi:hypothetical protein OAO18_06795 [Francisellaceae bacterium]|nr:hypothetical protein [Francisellaceae bacterium]